MKSIFGLILFSIIILASCKNKGCTDITADNFSSSAGKDDGSCVYTGSIVFWFDDTTGNEMYANSVPTVDIYIDYVRTDSLHWNEYTSVAPVCGISGYTEKVDLSGSASKTLFYYVKTPPDIVTGFTTILDSGYVTIDRGVCLPVEIDSLF